jgi:hypothetical protein
MNREEFVLKALIAAANDIVAGNRKRRWLWFGIPPAARSGIFCSRATDAINE